MDAPNQTQAVCLRLWWKTFQFFRSYEVIFMDTRVWSLPCSRFIHSFFRSKANANRNSSVRMLPLPVSETGGTQSRF